MSATTTTATRFEDCCWCIPVKLDKSNTCTRCGHAWKQETQS